MRYLLLIYAAEATEHAARGGDGRLDRRVRRVHPTSASAALLEAGEALHPTTTATTVRVVDGEDASRPTARSRRPRRRSAASTWSRPATSTRRSSTRRRSRRPATARSRSARSGSFGDGAADEPRAVATDPTPAPPDDRACRPPRSRTRSSTACSARSTGRAVATLIRVLGDFDLAEEAVQEAFVTALETWPARGVPDNPRRLDHDHGPEPGDRPAAARPAARARRRSCSVGDAAIEAELAAIDPDAAHRRSDAMSPIADDRLRLIFTCCHPALAMDARVALTLRTLGGLSTPGDRPGLPRARSRRSPSGSSGRSARSATPGSRIACRRPSALPERLDGVLRVLYLVFNEGYARLGGRRADPARAVRRGDPAGPGPGVAACPTSPRRSGCWR